MVIMFITENDYIQVSADALKILQQATEENRWTAERRAMDRITSYLDGRYDMRRAFSAEGEGRNYDLVGLVADFALYFMVLSLPGRMNYEIRKEQFETGISFLEKVQSGKAVMDLPVCEEEDGEGGSSVSSVRYGSEKRNNYIW
ncbi:hypothetical protein B5F91_03195 [Bacteroides sp. An322]|nr:hypothetical protein B5F91_03195 [Bacteroides sp. An322]